METEITYEDGQWLLHGPLENRPINLSKTQMDCIIQDMLDGKWCEKNWEVTWGTKAD